MTPLLERRIWLRSFWTFDSCIERLNSNKHAAQVAVA
jgi:hypothetical protein